MDSRATVRFGKLQWTFLSSPHGLLNCVKMPNSRYSANYTQQTTVYCTTVQCSTAYRYCTTVPTTMIKWRSVLGPSVLLKPLMMKCVWKFLVPPGESVPTGGPSRQSTSPSWCRHGR